MTAYHEISKESGSGRSPRQSEETDVIAAYLLGLAAAGSSSERIARAVASLFQGAEQALVPIVGQRGVAALYKRSLHLARNPFPWLPESPAGAPTAMDVSPLTTELARRTATDAASGSARVLQNFHELLTILIGASLTERLLRSVWVTFLSGPSAQGNTQWPPK